MKLHKILIRHYSQKDSKEGIVTYVVADNEQEIFDRLDAKNGPYTYGGWRERSEDTDDENDDSETVRNDAGHELLEIYDDDYKVIGRETYLERMLRLRGEFNDDDAEVEDAYYGVTHYGWDEGVEIGNEDACVLLRLGIAKDWRVIA